MWSTSLPHHVLNTQILGTSESVNMPVPRWSRPSSVPFPSIWRQATGRKPLEDGRVPTFLIQDVSDELMERVVDFMCGNFLRSETVCKSSRLWEDATSLAEIRDLWRKVLAHRVGLVALVEGETDAEGRPYIAGVNVTSVSHKADKGIPFSFQGTAMRKVIGALEHIDAKVDVFEHYGVSEYMTALGLSVSPEFRGQGLGIELLRARFDLGRAVGLPLTVTVFTAMSSQILAHRVDMEVLAEVEYDQYREDGQVIFPDVATKSMKLMAKRIEQDKPT